MNNAWALLRLASPQLPIGGYSYSQGLEMAVENGTVNDVRASRETRELQLESRQMGYSLKQLLLGLAELDIPARRYLAQIEEPHLALGWALAARAWNIPAQDALAAWLWSWLENQLAVLMKTLPLGQQAAQRLTTQLLPTLQLAQRNATELDPQHYGSAAFGLSLASMAHERQYSRLFRS
ncbi:urease accessory protein UreF [Pseudomonas putida]|nr:urease accessory protein UreF [Pseudomonas putida]